MNPLPARFAEYIATLRDAGEQPSMRHYPGLPAQAWYDPARIPAARDLEQNAAQIAAEFRRVDPRAFVPENEPIERRGEWDVFMLYERGRRNDDHCAQMPTAAAIIERNRTVRTLAGLSYVSRLAPHTRVAPHSGPTNLRVRLHLGIDVPPRCGIRAGEKSAVWEPGKCIAFDDSFPHEVWNDGDEARIVLVVDVWHPELSDDEVRLLDGFGRYIAYAAEGLRGYWRPS